jgi:tetraacyldisaccharide 4'-kinase
MREPAFWWRDRGSASALLAPVALVYGSIAANRLRRSGARAGVPVLCIGNFTLGGAGKTPTAITLTEMLVQAGETPFYLSRGYGGRNKGPHRVGPADDAANVGDEPLLLTRSAPTIVSHDRVAGAALAKTQGASVIVMDDGLQNPSLAKNFTLAVIDGRRGIGNGCVFPAGPLRAPLAAQLARTDALLVIGDGNGADPVIANARSRGLPVFHGRLAFSPDAAAELKGRQAFAFAGIGDPQKFFIAVAEAGITVARQKAFPDHHRFTAEDAADLVMRAEREGLVLITTEKDYVRMGGDAALKALTRRAHVLPVTLALQEPDELQRTMLEKLRR